MTTPEEHESAGTMSLTEMKGWLNQEIRDSEKAHELRIKDAKNLVDDYEAGRITAKEVNDRLYQYDKRWGEALPGTIASPGKSDEQILAEVDGAHVAFRKLKPLTASIRTRDREDTSGEHTR
jgi:hypothetical protein